MSRYDRLEAAGQCSLFAMIDPPPQPATSDPATKTEPEPLHPVLQLLIDAGLLDRYSAGFDYPNRDPKHEERPAPWNAPSRLFQFPCSIREVEGEVKLLVETERLKDHPWVKELAEASGLEPKVREGEERWGCHGLYHHAVDLISAGKWLQLLDLRDFTDAESIMCAVNYGLDYGHLAAADARVIMTAIGSDEPNGPGTPTAGDALRIVDLGECAENGKNKRRTIYWKSGPGPLATTWGRIAGFERGWFTLRGRDHKIVEWTDKAEAEQKAMRNTTPEPPTTDPVPSREQQLEEAYELDGLKLDEPSKLQPDAPKTEATKPKRKRKDRAPAATPVVIADPQIPPEGAFAKINGRWHQWRGTESLSGSQFGWYLCKPYYSRAHLSDTPPKIDNSGKTQPKGWIIESDGTRERVVTIAGVELNCKPGEPDPELVEVRGVPCVIKWSWGFSTHAIDRDKPFWSHTGFFSFSGSTAKNVAEAIAEIEAMIDADGLEPWKPLFEEEDREAEQ